MKKLFPGYIRPTEDEFQNLWDTCIFSLDANVLLRLYEYTPKTREDFLKVLSKIAPRAWLTHQAAWEYMRRRLVVIRRQVSRIEKIKTGLEEARDQALNAITRLSWHPFFHGDTQSKISKSISKNINNLIKKIDGVLVERNEKYPDWNEWQNSDPILDKLLDIFDGKIGTPYDDKIYKDKLEEANDRCENNIPPGYKDYKPKDPENSFGDVLIWFQLIDKAKNDKKPIIFVTGDSKEDWWSSFEGQTVGPRPKLIQEFLSKTDQQYYQYQPLRFMELAKEHFKVDVREESMTEVEEISKKAEESDRQKAYRAAAPYTRHDMDVFLSNARDLGVSGELSPNVDWASPKIPDWTMPKIPDWAIPKMPDWTMPKMPDWAIPKMPEGNIPSTDDISKRLGMSADEFNKMLQRQADMTQAQIEYMRALLSLSPFPKATKEPVEREAKAAKPKKKPPNKEK